MKRKGTNDHAVPSHALERDLCFGSGHANLVGLRLKFSLGPSGKSYICNFLLDGTFVGPNGYAHEGIIATVLDEAMGQANKLRRKVALTRRMTVEYLRPVPLDLPLVVEGCVRRMTGRTLYNSAELRNVKGETLARSQGTFLAINAEKMFARELEKEDRETP